MRYWVSPVMGALLCAFVAVGLVGKAGSDPSPVPSEYRYVSEIIDWDAFHGLDPMHQGFLVRLAQDSAQWGPTTASCFSGDMGWRYREAFDRAIQGYSRAQLTSRWSITATDGSGLSQGDPTVLTYSFMPDGAWIPSGVGEASGPSELFAVWDANFSSTQEWQDRFHDAFAQWGELCGITYVHEPNDDGATRSSSNVGILGVRGDVRIGAHFIDGASGSNVLAYNSFPNHGDMVLDSSNISFYASTSQNWRNLRNVITHEHGHGMGLLHVCPIDFSFPKLMEPFFSASYDGPRHDDVLGAQRQYGDRFEHNDSSGTATDLGPLGTGFYTISDLGMDDNNESDYFKFTVAVDSKAGVTLRPVGFTYNQGPQTENCDTGSLFNSLVQNNLGVEIRDTNGSTVLASADAQPAGIEEVLNGVVLPSGPGTYFVRVFSGSTNATQLYDLDLRVVDRDCNQNSILDEDDLTSGTSADCNGNEILDECEINENSTAPGGPFFCTAGCDADGNDNGVPDVCDVAANDCNDNQIADFNETPQFLIRNLSSAVQPPPAATAPLSQDLHPGDAALLTRIEVTYRSLGSIGGNLIMRVFQGSSDNAVVPVVPDGLIAEYNVGALETATGTNHQIVLDLNPPIFIPADIWLETEFVTAGGSFGVVRKSGSPSTGESDGLVYDRSMGTVSGPDYMNLRLLGVLCLSDCNLNGVRDLEDIAGGTSSDCQANSTPDECEPDSDGDLSIDGCESCPNEPALLVPEDTTETECGDGIDNDCDGLTDGADTADCTVGCSQFCGDFDADGGVNLIDFITFSGCFGLPPDSSPDCLCSDLDGDQSIVLGDFLIFAGLFGSSSTHTPPSCP